MKWFRIWPDAVFYGTTFQELTAEERGIWFSLMVMAALGEKKELGVVEMRAKVPYEDEVLAKLLNCKAGVFRSAVKRLVEVDKVVILPDKRIKIKNWDKYQTRYERYYKHNRHTEKLADVCRGDVDGEEEVDKRESAPPDWQSRFAEIYRAHFCRVPNIADLELASMVRRVKNEGAELVVLNQICIVDKAAWKQDNVDKWLRGDWNKKRPFDKPKKPVYYTGSDV